MAGERMVDNPTGDVGPLTFEEDTSSGHDTTSASEESVKIPEKFDGKSMEDVIKSYSELEKAHGRQSQEVGELRRMADNLLKNQSQSVPEASASDAVTPDIYEDPDGFVAAQVKKAVQPLEQRLAANDQDRMIQQLSKSHPDYLEVAVAPDFLSWVNQDPYRQNQYLQANNHNYDAANNLFSTWKDTKSADLETKRKEKEEQLSDASMVTGTTGETSKTVYNRAALVNLQIQDPAKYEALQPEIMAAYAQGRVR